MTQQNDVTSRKRVRGRGHVMPRKRAATARDRCTPRSVIEEVSYSHSIAEIQILFEYSCSSRQSQCHLVRIHLEILKL